MLTTKRRSFSTLSRNGHSPSMAIPFQPMQVPCRSAIPLIIHRAGWKKNMWWAILGQKTKSAMIANSSWSGATVAFHQALDSISFFYSDYRIASLARNGVPNVIFVLGGTNDWNRSIPLGNVTDVDKVTTVCGAYSLMVRKLKRFYPNSTIILCGILPRKQGVNTKNRSGWTIKQGNNAIRKIAESLQVAYIDMEDCGMAQDIQSCTRRAAPQRDGHENDCR